MARGIHLKQLKYADLHAIGVLTDKMGETADGENEWPLSLLAEADPVLSRTLEEVCRGLEATLLLLDEALTANPAMQTQPPPVRKE